MKNKGFGFIEFLIVLSVLAIAGSLISRFVMINYQTLKVSRGVTGTVETRCIDGLKFIVGYYGFAQQIISADGKPATCQQ